VCGADGDEHEYEYEYEHEHEYEYEYEHGRVAAVAGAGGAGGYREPEVPSYAEFSGKDPFDPPEVGPRAKSAPPAPRPADKTPSAAEIAARAQECAKYTNCNDCNEHAYRCGFCLDSETCTPGDRLGPFPGTCGSDWGDALSEHGTWRTCELSTRGARENDAYTRRALAEALRGMQPLGQPIDVARADRERAVTLPIGRGRCWSVAIRESFDSERDFAPQVSADATFYEGGELRPVSASGWVTRPVCPQNNGSLRVTSTGKGKRGTWRVQLFAAPIDEGRLRDQRARHERATPQTPKPPPPPEI
jgi:hypothetical protein